MSRLHLELIYVFNTCFCYFRVKIEKLLATIDDEQLGLLTRFKSQSSLLWSVLNKKKIIWEPVNTAALEQLS